MAYACRLNQMVLHWWRSIQEVCEYYLLHSLLGNVSVYIKWDCSKCARQMSVHSHSHSDSYVYFKWQEKIGRICLKGYVNFLEGLCVCSVVTRGLSCIPWNLSKKHLLTLLTSYVPHLPWAFDCVVQQHRNENTSGIPLRRSRGACVSWRVYGAKSGNKTCHYHSHTHTHTHPDTHTLTHTQTQETWPHLLPSLMLTICIFQFSSGFGVILPSPLPPFCVSCVA